MNALQELIGVGSPVFTGTLIAILAAGIVSCFFGYRVRKLLFAAIVLGTGTVLGFQLMRVLSANVWFCLGIGTLCGVILCILSFRFYRPIFSLLCAALFFFIVRTLLSRDDWWVYVAATLGALGAGFSAFHFEKQMAAVVSGFLGAYMAAAAGFFLIGSERGILFWAALVVAGVAGVVLQFVQGAGKQETLEEESLDAEEEKGKAKREKKSHGKNESEEQKERHARRRQARG